MSGEEPLAWIMVHQDPSSFWSLVSPQIPIILQSAIEAATRRLRDWGVTDCEKGVKNYLGREITKRTVSASTVNIYS